MEEIFSFITSNVEWAPWIIFGALLLAGFNIPVSEDGMLFISGVLAAKNPEMTVPLFAGVFAGAYLSDLICFSLGSILGPRLWKIQWFANMVKPELVNKINGFYEKYGFVTLLFGRFIPFGVRNGLFLTAGLGKMNPVKFAVADLIAATISCSIYFYLYFTYGNTVVEIIKQSNVVIFGLAIIVVAVVVYKKRRSRAR